MTYRRWMANERKDNEQKAYSSMNCRTFVGRRHRWRWDWYRKVLVQIHTTFNKNRFGNVELDGSFLNINPILGPMPTIHYKIFQANKWSFKLQIICTPIDDDSSDCGYACYDWIESHRTHPALIKYEYDNNDGLQNITKINQSTHDGSGRSERSEQKETDKKKKRRRRWRKRKNIIN